MSRTVTLPSNSFHQIHSSLSQDKDVTSIRQHLIYLLEDLQYVEETSIHHPESDALFHSLQVYQLALVQSDDPSLHCAALFHDIGKSMDYPNHADAGADALDHYLSPKIVWLIRHHLDLLTRKKRTRKQWEGSKRLIDLKKLRRWDLQGRDVDAEVMSVTAAVDMVLLHYPIISDLSNTY